MSEAPIVWRAWLDVDGYHVWIRHKCRLTEVTSMLPHPTWSSNNVSTGGQRVVPPVSCGICGISGQPAVAQFDMGDVEALERWLVS